MSSAVTFRYRFRADRGSIRLFSLAKWLVCALFAILFAIPGVRAESPGDSTGVLAGRLTDWHSVPLEQAVVVVRNLSTGATTRGITGKNGSYRFTGLGPGEYRLEADVPQLGKGAVEGILVSAGHATRVQAALVMELPVQAAPPASIEAEVHGLDPVTPAVTTMIPSDELNALPISSRNWQEFAAITPGATPASQSGSRDDLTGADSGDEAQSISMEGGNAFQTASSIDGIATTPAFHTESGGQSRATESAGLSSVGQSAVLTLEARTGDAPSEASHNAGGAIDVTTARGHNGLHGQAFYLNRQSLWGAQNPFTQWIQKTAPTSGIDVAQFATEPYSPANSRQTFGLGVGSQIRRDKLFWFAALDGLLRNNPAVATVRHADEFFAQPTNDELRVLAQRLALPGPAILEQAAAAYSSGLEQLAGLLGPVPRSTNQWQGFARVDWQASERQHLNVEGNIADVNSPGGGLGLTSETFGSHSFGNVQASDGWGLAKWDSFLTANLLNATAVQFRRHVQSETPQTPSAFEAPLIGPSASNDWGRLPEIIADSKYGFILGKPARLGNSKYPDERIFDVQDTLSWVRGGHLVKAGGSFDHVSDAVDTLVNQTGTYSYADVLNFISDTASFEKYGLTDINNLNPDQHNCDATGRVHTTNGVLSGLGNLPCYAWYSQRIGPSNWHLSTNDLAAFSTEQWQPLHNLTISAGLRLEAEQLPAPIATVENPDLPATQRMPGMGLNWGPRVGLAWAPFSSSSGRATVLRAGAGLYFGRIDNGTALAALTQTGSANGDLNFFFKPTDNSISNPTNPNPCEPAPCFPYVFPVQPQTIVKPGAVSFAPNFRSQEVDQAVVSVEQELPSHWLVSVSALASLGRRLPISVDTNLGQTLDANGKPQTITYDVVDTLGAGPVKTPTITVPLYDLRPNANYQQLSSIESRANSTYDAAMFKIVRYGGHGLSLHAHYLYAHATDWNPNESGQVAGNDVLDPQDFRLEYGTSNLDIRHSAAATVLYTTPWKLQSWAGSLANAWSIAAVGQFRSGLPYTMRTSGYIPGFYDRLLAGGMTLIEGVGPSMNGSGGANRIYGIGRNTYRYPATWTGDARIAKRFDLAHNRQLELLAESFNLFNHQNVTLTETIGYYIDRGTTTGGPATLNFMTGLTKAGLPSTTAVEFGKPLDVNATNFYRPREFQLGVRARF